MVSVVIRYGELTRQRIRTLLFFFLVFKTVFRSYLDNKTAIVFFFSFSFFGERDSSGSDHLALSLRSAIHPSNTCAQFTHNLSQGFFFFSVGFILPPSTPLYYGLKLHEINAFMNRILFPRSSGVVREQTNERS